MATSEEKEYRDKIEAILFTTGRFVSAGEIARLCGFKHASYVQEILRELRREYNGKNGALELIELEGKWKLSLKPRFGQITNQLVSDAEFDKPTQKTLAIIAFKEPVLQANVIKLRGNKAYEHIDILKDKGLISSEKYGRTRMLKITPKFYEYFDVNKEGMNKLKKIEDGIKKAMSDIISKTSNEEPQAELEEKNQDKH